MKLWMKFTLFLGWVLLTGIIAFACNVEGYSRGRNAGERETAYLVEKQAKQLDRISQLAIDTRSYADELERRVTTAEEGHDTLIQIMARYKK